MPIRIASVMHQVHGHFMQARTDEQAYCADGSPVDWHNLRPCVGCGCHIGKDDHDPCIANLPGTTHACCGHGLPDEVTHRPVIEVDADGKLAVGTEKRVHSWGYVELEDGRRIEFEGTCGGARIRAAVDAALNDRPLPDGFRYAQ
jgi:hypothetical protein